VVVILSTHIVEDVYELCPAMAVMAGGRILAQGAPASLIGALEGRLWGMVVDTDAVADHHARHEVVSTRMIAGRTELQGRWPTRRPSRACGRCSPRSKIVYFATLAQHGFDLAIA
jgi:ABC-2 type transport system ATP-binding protein